MSQFTSSHHTSLVVQSHSVVIP